MVVYQESFNRHNGMERRLFLNGKSYIQRCNVRDREVLDCENDLTLQVIWDYEHYPRTDESLEPTTFNHLRYGVVADQVFSLCHSKFPNHAAMTLYDVVQRTMVADGATPYYPVQEIPEMENVWRRVSFHHDGSVEETMVYTYEEVPYWTGR